MRKHVLGYLGDKPELLNQIKAEAVQLSEKLDIEREKSSKVTVITKKPELSLERTLAQAYLEDLEKGNIKINGTPESVYAGDRYYELDGVVYRADGRDRRYNKDLNASSVEIVDIPFGKLCYDICMDCCIRLYMEHSKEAKKSRIHCHNFARALEITEESTDSSKPVVSIKGERSYFPYRTKEDVIRQLPSIEDVAAILEFFQQARENASTVVSRPSGTPYSAARVEKALEDCGGKAFGVEVEQEK